MKRFLIAFLLVFHVGRAALPATVVWEVRTAGSDTNGGGFVAGASGTDMSQFDNKNLGGCTNCQSTSVNISTTDSVANGTTTITSATANFSAAIVGNIVFFTGGTGSIAAQWRQVTAFTNSTTITIEATIAASTGMTMNIGGALLTLGNLSGVMIASNKAFIKAGTYSTTTTNTFAQTVTMNATTPATKLIGYNTSRGDCTTGPRGSCAGRPTISLGAGSITGMVMSGGSSELFNFIIDCNSQTTSTGLNLSGNGHFISGVKIANCSGGVGLVVNSTNTTVADIEVAAVTNAAIGGCVNILAPVTILRGYIHNCTTAGFQAVRMGTSGGTVIKDCIIANNSAIGVGITTAPQNLAIIDSTLYGNGGDAIQIQTSLNIEALTIQNNIIANTTGWGIRATTAAYPASANYDGNAFFSNSSGNRSNMDDTSTNAIDGVNPYTNVNDIALSASPFTAPGSSDWSLNNTAGGGAAIRGKGFPGPLPGLSTIGSRDIGALQSASTGGSGASTFIQ